MLVRRRVAVNTCVADEMRDGPERSVEGDIV